MSTTSEIGNWRAKRHNVEEDAIGGGWYPKWSAFSVEAELSRSFQVMDNLPSIWAGVQLDSRFVFFLYVAFWTAGEGAPVFRKILKRVNVCVCFLREHVGHDVLLVVRCRGVVDGSGAVLYMLSLLRFF